MSRSVFDGDSEGVEVTGPDDAQQIVFVHGTIFNRTMWAPQREELAEEFRVITFDMPGHGTRSAEAFKLDPAIETLRDVLDNRADGNAHVVGHSLGGYVAMEYARRYPETVDGLVLADSSANPVGFLGKLTYAIGKAAVLASRSERIERATSWINEKYVRSRDLRPEIQKEIIEAGFTLRPFGEAGIEIAGEDFRSAFAAFPGPALVVNGQFDLVMRLAEKDHANAGTADVTVIDGAGHISNLDRPESYTAAVARFVDPARTVGAGD
jgi:pimeloyl-ACP methyl ester carboxylesterase